MGWSSLLISSTILKRYIVANEKKGISGHENAELNMQKLTPFLVTEQSRHQVRC
jgi:hypothetical protein